MPLERCVTCGKEFDLRFHTSPGSFECPECAQQRAQAVRAADMQQPRATLSATSSPVTIALIAANALVFAAMVFSGVSALDPTPDQAIAFGADVGRLTLNGQWWRLVTSMFVHFGIIHIGLNMWCLWNLGRAAEALMGRFSYLLAYFVSGIFGSIASVYWHPQAAGAGASGAIFGLAGVLVSFVYLKKTLSHLQLNSKFLGSLGTFIAYNLIFGAAIPGISNAAHVGGLVMGGAVGALLPNAAASESSRRARLSLLAVVSVIVLVASAFAAKQLRAGPAVSPNELASIQQLIQTGKSGEALTQLEQITARQPGLAPAQAMLASLYFAKSRYPDAIAAMEKACEDDPGNSTYQQKLGGAYINLGEFDQAITYFRKLAAHNPNDSFANLGLGVAYMGKHQYDAAIPPFQKAVTLNPKSPQPQHFLGQAQLHAGRFADAQQTYRRLLTQFPTDTQAQGGLAYATHQLH